MTVLWRARVSKKKDEIKNDWKNNLLPDENSVKENDINSDENTITGEDIHSKFLEQRVNRSDDFLKNPDSKKTVQDNEEVDFEGGYSAHLSKDHLNQFTIGDERSFLKKLFDLFNVQKLLQMVLHVVLKLLSMTVPSDSLLGKITSKIRYVLLKLLLMSRMKTLLRLFGAALMLKKKSKYKDASHEHDEHHEEHHEEHSQHHDEHDHPHEHLSHAKHAAHGDHSHHGHHAGYHLHADHAIHKHESHEFHNGMLHSMTLGHDAHAFHEPHPPHHEHHHEHFHHHAHNHEHYQEHRPGNHDIIGRIFHRIKQFVIEGADFVIGRSAQFLNGGVNPTVNINPNTNQYKQPNSQPHSQPNSQPHSQPNSQPNSNGHEQHNSNRNPSEKRDIIVYEVTSISITKIQNHNVYESPPDGRIDFGGSITGRQISQMNNRTQNYP